MQVAAQAVELPASCQVGGAIRTENSGEDAETVGNPAGNREVSPGSQVDLAAQRALLLEKFEQRAVVGKMRHIQ